VKLGSVLAAITGKAPDNRGKCFFLINPVNVFSGCGSGLAKFVGQHGRVAPRS
jgi:hypothetical protein